MPKTRAAVCREAARDASAGHRQRTTFAGSSWLTQGWYDPESQRVELEFVDGHHHVYEMIPADVWERFKRAGSPGRFVTEVLDRYPKRPR